MEAPRWRREHSEINGAKRKLHMWRRENPESQDLWGFAQTWWRGDVETQTPVKEASRAKGDVPVAHDVNRLARKCLHGYPSSQVDEQDQ